MALGQLTAEDPSEQAYEAEIVGQEKSEVMDTAWKRLDSLDLKASEQPAALADIVVDLCRELKSPHSPGSILGTMLVELTSRGHEEIKARRKELARVTKQADDYVAGIEQASGF